MSYTPRSLKTLLRVMPFLILLIAVAAHGQEKTTDSNAKADSSSKDVRLTIVVTGGEDKKPIDSASVYVRFVEEHKHGKDKKIEMNLKTNQSGECHVPVIPPGKFLVQVIADGWKTYGEYYDINQAEQTINITLARPPKWY
ncbi:MAG TPA: carboxypeptidase-like regulatory domain-containing protein [Candidatus Acidoferrum sp.]|nr:carboxypeptidase-like regulatory domain-containing protein [Candidatus Acidoferrum sp.]